MPPAALQPQKRLAASGEQRPSHPVRQFFIAIYEKLADGVLQETALIRVDNEADAIRMARSASRHNDGALAFSEIDHSHSFERRILKTFGAVWG